MAGDGEFDEFVRTRGEDLRRLAFLLTSRREDAERLVETVLARCLARWSRLEKAGDPYAQARSMLLAAHRPRRLVVRRGRAGAGMVGDAADMRDELRRGLPSLRGMQRKVVVLRHFEGLSEEDAAATLETSLATVRRHEQDALDRLRSAAAGPGQPPPDLAGRTHARLRSRRRSQWATAAVIAGLVVAGVTATSSRGGHASPVPQALATGGTVPQSAVTDAPYVAPPIPTARTLGGLPPTRNLVQLRTVHGAQQLWLYDAATVEPVRALASADGGGVTTGLFALDPDRNDRVVFVRQYTMRTGRLSPDDPVELQAWRLFELSILTRQSAALTDVRVGAPPDQLVFSPQGHRLAIVTGTDVEIMNTYDDGVGPRFLNVPRRFTVIGFLSADGPLLTSYIRPTGDGPLPDVQLVTAIDVDDPTRTDVVYTSDTTRCEPTQQAWGTPSGHLVLRTRCPVTRDGSTQDVLGFFDIDAAGAHLITGTSLAVGYVPHVTWTSSGDAFVEEFDGSCGAPPVVDRVTVTGTRTRISGRFTATCHH
jgi:DNA-directed RNA polymerase specialized sigma24 family protein